MVIIDRTPAGPRTGDPLSGFELTPEQVSLRELAAEVAREVYAPKAAEWDRDRTPLPDDEVQRLAKLGFLGMVLPEEARTAVVAGMTNTAASTGSGRWSGKLVPVLGGLPSPKPTTLSGPRS
jgi:alkylation response protein AidB-like acyl-CoA dehydrogenase